MQQMKDDERCDESIQDMRKHSYMEGSETRLAESGCQGDPGWQWQCLCLLLISMIVLVRASRTSLTSFLLMNSFLDLPSFFGTSATGQIWIDLKQSKLVSIIRTESCAAYSTPQKIYTNLFHAAIGFSWFGFVLSLWSWSWWWSWLLFSIWGLLVMQQHSDIGWRDSKWLNDSCSLKWWQLLRNGKNT